MHRRDEPSFFFTNSTGAPHGETLVMEIKIKKGKMSKMKVLKRILAHHPFYLKGLQ